MGCSFPNTEWHSRCIYIYIYVYIYTSYNRTHIRNAYIYILIQSFWMGTKVIRRKHIIQPIGFGACSSTCCQFFCAAPGRPSHCLRQQSLDSYGTTLRKHWAWNAGCRVRLRTLPHVHVWQEFHGHLRPQATRDDLLEKPNGSSTSSTAHVAQGPRIRFCYQVQAR